MSRTRIRDRIGLVTDVFMGAANADDRLLGAERAYIADLIADLLSVAEPPDDLVQRIEQFDPQRFDAVAAARDFLREPPMSGRRLLELVTCVTLADGTQSEREAAYICALGAALGLPPRDYADLIGEQLLRGQVEARARVPLPEAIAAPRKLGTLEASS